MCEKKQDGQFSKQKKNNLLQYAIQLVCVLKWNKRDSFQKKSNWWQYAAELVSEKKQEGQFSKNNNLLQYAIQLVCVLKWKKMGSFQKNPIDDNMLLNSCTYWNETRGTVFKKNPNWWQYAIQQEGQFSKNNNITVWYSTCVRKWNKRGSFHKKTTIYYSMLFN